MAQPFTMNWHECRGTVAAKVPTLSEASVTRSISLPGGVTATFTATVEILADGTRGGRTGVRGSISTRPPDADALAFVNALTAAINAALDEALEKASGGEPERPEVSPGPRAGSPGATLH